MAFAMNCQKSVIWFFTVNATSFKLFAIQAGLLGVDECGLSAYASLSWYR
jgi:hypothetical protein